MMQQETPAQQDTRPKALPPQDLKEQEQQPRTAPLTADRDVPRRRRRFWVLLAFLALAAAGYAVWRIWFAAPPVPPGVIQVSGRIEGDVSSIAPKVGGRVREVRNREGDAVQAGAVIAVLSDERIAAREDQARGGLAAAKAKAQSARDQVAVLQQQLQQYQIQVAQAKVEATGQVQQAEASLAAAKAELTKAQAAYEIALFDKNAYERLAKTGAASERQAKEATTTADQQAAAVAAERRRVEAAQGSLTTARSNLANPQVRAAQAGMIERQMAQQRAEIASAQASIKQAEGQLREAQVNREDLIVRAPFSGTIATRAAEPGEVVNAGTTLVTLVDLSKVYLKAFVPVGEIGKVKARQQGRVFLDSAPNTPIPAHVSRIAPQATFTPENIYFRDERVKQVVEVRLQLDGAVGFAKPGMPADGEILVQGDTWPQTRRPISK
jgi:HlyD family secretion protein